MKRFAVAYIDAFDNDLQLIIVHAEDWKTALMQHPKTADYPIANTHSYRVMQEEFWNCDANIAVTEIVD